MDKNIIFKNLLKESIEFKSICENLTSQIVPTAVFGVEWGSFIFNILALLEEVNKLVVTVENEADATKLYDEITPHFSNVHILPKLELAFFDAYSHSHQIENNRLEAIYSLLEDEHALIIMPVDSMFHPMNTPEVYKAKTVSYALGDTLEMSTFLKQLVSYGYYREDIVEAKGQFAVRGGIVDIFMPRYDTPIRIEFFGDEIDSLRAFNLETQLSSQNLERFTLRPCREGLLFDAQIDDAQEYLKTKTKDSSNALFKRILENFNQGICPDDSYKLLPLYLKECDSIFSYIAKTPIITWGYNRLSERNTSRYQDWIERFKMHLEKGEVVSEQIQLMLSPESWVSGIQHANTLIFSGLKTPITNIKLQAIIDYHFREATLYHSQLEMAVEDIKRWVKSRYTVWIMVNGEDRAEGVLRLLKDHNLERYINEDNQGIQIFNQGFVSGFNIDTFKAVVITERELYGERRTRRKVKVKHARSIKSFSDISEGDYVVHDLHGIGQYQGVFQLTVDGQKKDFLKITYKAEDTLYVPVEKMETLQKYIGSEAKVVRLNKLGTSEWKQTKYKVKKAIEDMTDALVELYAKRRQQKGFAFSKDNEWQRQFENSFPYQETEDQLKCIREIKQDMEASKPMDRLLCGDVGYGKTEVAMRAVFKAVNDSKQVAILVPTTILAQQHYDTLQHRFSKYPVSIGVLSRFKTKKEVNKTIDDLRTGVIDIVVGTHRLLSQDVRFKDLGLLIVDEEQRFGVKHKERIKQLKSNIDVLTLTATPIPRTLHMSLVGIRDLSTIEDPPEDRYPIQTYVLDYQPSAVREAILREIDRKGQVYFVHNRVGDIDKITSQLQKLVPEARIHYAHGKMKETELESKMYDFMNGAFDVLVSTTIVETGLDISNVNTMIIHHADKFGLSQLYQLRGRVGRSNRLAYAYLTYERQKIISEVAEKRLKAIKEFTDLGSGFKIAMRDLELRGAGSILGGQQHGHLASVGYEMYCKMLEDAVLTAKGETRPEPIDSSIEIPCEAYIPEYYIANSKFKLDLYKRISAMRDKADRMNIEDDLIDLYGDIPRSVINLVLIGYIRSMAAKQGFEKVVQSGTSVELSYSLATKVNPLLISHVLDAYNGRGLKFIGSQQSFFRLNVKENGKDSNTILKSVASLLETFDTVHDKVQDIDVSMNE